MRSPDTDNLDGETAALLHLSLCRGVGALAIHRLLEKFGSAAKVMELDRKELTSAQGISTGLAEAILSGPEKERMESELDLLERCDTRLCAISSDSYPEPLRHLDRDAPPLLRIRGRYRDGDRLAIALVGSRNCTHYGRAQGRRFSMALAEMGFTIVSGLARGIDSECHRAALQAGGRTIAVLGCGISRLDALSDPELALKILENGALISELPMDAPPLARHFPPRNRLISGLSTGVIVVEAGIRSGSLITARMAGEHGRAVFAVPGSVDSPSSRGCHQLIRDGAILIERPGEVPEQLGPLASPVPVNDDEGTSPAGERTSMVEDTREMILNEREKTVLGAVQHEPRHLDELIDDTQLAVSLLSGTLMSLEIRGLVTRLEGDRYVRS